MEPKIIYIGNEISFAKNLAKAADELNSSFQKIASFETLAALSNHNSLIIMDLDNLSLDTFQSPSIFRPDGNLWVLAIPNPDKSPLPLSHFDPTFFHDRSHGEKIVRGALASINGRSGILSATLPKLRPTTYNLLLSN